MSSERAALKMSRFSARVPPPVLHTATDAHSQGIIASGASLELRRRKCVLFKGIGGRPEWSYRCLTSTCGYFFDIHVAKSGSSDML
jgi:hypothetical protein